MSGSKLSVIRVGLWSIITMAITAVTMTVAIAPVQADPVDEVEEDIEAEFHDLEAIIEDYNKIYGELEDTKDQIAELEKELKPYQKKLDVLYERVGEFASNVYMNGTLSSATALLSNGSPESLTDRMTMLDTVAVSDNAAISELKAATADMDERKAVLDDLETDQAARESTLREKKETIEADLERLQTEREDAYRDSRGLGDDGWVPPYVPGDRGEVVRFALAQEGKPYVWAASGPDGFDCSGLILRAWAQVGVSLPHNAEAMWNQVTHISRDQLQPGDIVFYNGLSHAALYIGDDHVVQAAINYYDVSIETVDSAASSYYGAGRIPGW